MKEIRVSLIEAIPRTATVKSFRFRPKERLEFIPGQFMQVIFDEAGRENKDLNKYLSFSSAPGKEHIEFTKRLSSSHFSQRLRDLKPGDEILIKAPLGNCVFNPEYKKVFFLIGGIGITPVISILEYITDKKLDTDVCLLYSNRTEEEIAFKPELDNWSAKNQNIKVTYAVSDCQPKDNACIFGRIDKDLISRRVCGLGERIIFVFGPPKMVEAMTNLCLELSCDKGKIKTESFIGY